MRYTLKITSAVALGGVVRPAGSIVDLDEATAKNLLQRGKAELTEKSPPPPAPDGPIGTDDTEGKKKGATRRQRKTPSDEQKGGDA